MSTLGGGESKFIIVSPVGMAGLNHCHGKVKRSQRWTSQAL